MEKVIQKFNWIRWAVLLILSVGIILFEDLHTRRFYVFLGILSILFLLQFLKLKGDSKGLFYIFLIEIALIFTLELNSRYAVNYFIHSLYVLVIFESALKLPHKKSIITGSLVLLLSSYKYIYIINIRRSIGALAQFAFFLTLNISILVVVNLLRSVFEAKKKQDLLHEKLEEMNKQRERNRISREIHDTLGHQMVNIMMQLEMLKIENDCEKLPKVIQDVRDTHKILRNIVEKNYDDLSVESTDVKKLLDDFEKKSPIKLKRIIAEDIYYPKTIYRIIRESLTNAGKYSQATEIQVSLSVDEHYIYFEIRDNGIGCDNIRKSIGLKGIEKSVEIFDGDVSFSGDDGFSIKGYIRRIKND